MEEWRGWRRRWGWRSRGGGGGGGGLIFRLDACFIPLGNEHEP